ncbi:hypothetical protein [Mesorhizobium sp. M1322]|uniref:hypothetical protein n=1 Tax=Mesorhizobium sp. M1322 TaxID=2957081 RepID=UPI00333A7903
MPPTFTLGLPLNRRNVLISASALSASFAFHWVPRVPRGLPPTKFQKENTPWIDRHCLLSGA